MGINKKDLTDLLKENLTIVVDKEYPYSFSGDDMEPNIKIQIYFAGELICEGIS